LPGEPPGMDRVASPESASVGHAQPLSGGLFHQLSLVLLENSHVDVAVGLQPILVSLDNERADQAQSARAKGA